MVMTAATAAAKAVTAAAVLKTSDKSQVHGPIARTVLAELTKCILLKVYQPTACYTVILSRALCLSLRGCCTSVLIPSLRAGSTR
jgi:hypothetical protein